MSGPLAWAHSRTAAAKRAIADMLAQPRLAAEKYGDQAKNLDERFKEALHSATRGEEAGMEQILGPMMDIAPTSAAAGAVSGAGKGLGVFVGSAARGGNARELLQAIAGEKKGGRPQDIWQDTGWARAPWDNLWRREIDDSSLRMKPQVSFQNPDGSFGWGSMGSLKYVAPHPGLFKAYPEAENIPAFLNMDPNLPVQYRGSFKWDGHPGSIKGELLGEARNEHELKKTVVHELQHGAQKAERFPSVGTNPGFFEAKGYSPVRAYELYRNNPGEAESRLTESRLLLTEDQRRDRFNFPYDPTNFFAATGSSLENLIKPGTPGFHPPIITRGSPLSDADFFR